MIFKCLNLRSGERLKWVKSHLKLKHFYGADLDHGLWSARSRWTTATSCGHLKDSCSSRDSLRIARAQLFIQLTAVENSSLTWQHISFHSGLVLCLSLVAGAWRWADWGSFFLHSYLLKLFYRSRGLVFYGHRLDVSHMFFFYWTLCGKLKPNCLLICSWRTIQFGIFS